MKQGKCLNIQTCGLHLVCAFCDARYWQLINMQEVPTNKRIVFTGMQKQGLGLDVYWSRTSHKDEKQGSGLCFVEYRSIRIVEVYLHLSVRNETRFSILVTGRL